MTSNNSKILNYSKSSAFYIDTKKDFFAENNKLLNKALQQNSLYTKQPRRLACKICDAALPEASDFRSHGVDYIFCPVCTHLNGAYQDTKEFVDTMYISDKGADYSVNYIDDDFLKRVSDIYMPKVDFMLEGLPREQYSLLDVGCGSGYFVYAALSRGIKATGIDVSQSMIDFGNNQISHLVSKSPLYFSNEEGFYDAIMKSDAGIVSAIGVIEHLREPHKFFLAFKESAAKYLYYSVPMFSMSVAIENIFYDVFPRQLSCGHTHLFTENSIVEMNRIIGVISIAEWRFGTDFVDLQRNMSVKLQQNGCSRMFFEMLDAGLFSKIDDLQSVIDKSHFCSEIHLLARKDAG